MLTVGVTFFIRRGEHSIWSNGADQNCVFLCMLLKQLPNVSRVFAINGGDGEEPHAGMMLAGLGIEFVKFQDVVDQLDVLIEAGAQVSAENVARVRARGGRAVAYKFGNAYVIDVEREIHGKQAGSIFNGSCFDEVWSIPQHMNTCASYWEACYRAPVRMMPHIWEPTFVDATTKEFPSDISFGYKSGSAKKRISILEPNINIVKTAHIPMLVAELSYRRAPHLMDVVYVTNALQLKEHLAFTHFASNLDIVKDGLCSFEGRFNTPLFLAKYTDVVVAHQWECGLNYAYYDALYGGYPLVHNSTLLPAGVGYYYNGFNAHDGGNALVSALLTHDARAEEYRSTADKFISTVRVSHPANLQAHESALNALFAARSAETLSGPSGCQ